MVLATEGVLILAVEKGADTCKKVCWHLHNYAGTSNRGGGDTGN
jgi:hypothetical protein